MIVITQKAKEKIKEFNVDNKKYLRLAIKGGGCSGHLFSLSYCDDIKPGDREFDGVLVDFKSYIMMDDDLTMDYDSSLNGKGFTYEAAVIKTKCGCGTSFSV